MAILRKVGYGYGGKPSPYHDNDNHQGPPVTYDSKGRPILDSTLKSSYRYKVRTYFEKKLKAKYNYYGQNDLPNDAGVRWTFRPKVPYGYMGIRYNILVQLYYLDHAASPDKVLRLLVEGVKKDTAYGSPKAVLVPLNKRMKVLQSLGFKDLLQVPGKTLEGNTPVTALWWQYPATIVNFCKEHHINWPPQKDAEQPTADDVKDWTGFKFDKSVSHIYGLTGKDLKLKLQDMFLKVLSGKGHDVLEDHQAFLALSKVFDPQGYSALHYLAMQGYPATLEHPDVATVHAKDKSIPLFLFAKRIKSKPEKLKAFLDLVPEHLYAAENGKGVSLLHYMAYDCPVEDAAPALLKIPEAFTLAGKDGNTPAHLLADQLSEFDDKLLPLFKTKAGQSVKNSKGLTAYQLAIGSQMEIISDLSPEHKKEAMAVVEKYGSKALKEYMEAQSDWIGGPADEYAKKMLKHHDCATHLMNLKMPLGLFRGLSFSEHDKVWKFWKNKKKGDKFYLKSKKLASSYSLDFKVARGFGPWVVKIISNQGTEALMAPETKAQPWYIKLFYKHHSSSLWAKEKEYVVKGGKIKVELVNRPPKSDYDDDYGGHGGYGGGYGGPVSKKPAPLWKKKKHPFF